MIEWVQIAALPLAAVAVLLRRTERRIVTALRNAGAHSETSAVALPPIHRLGRWQVARLAKAGPILATDDERDYLDPAGYQRFRGARRSRAAIVGAVLVGAVLVLWFVSP